MSISNLKSINKILKYLVPLVFITFTFYILSFNSVHAQVPNPLIPCQDTITPDFHSLRPQPASPCVTEIVPAAKFCGNTLTLQDIINVKYQPGVDNCSPLPDGKVRCSYVKPISETITIDLSNAKLPIMGNTENVPNSQNPTGSPAPLSDTEKVNGYVSWYLNGVMNRAEDGSTKNNDYNTVNLSGPINKLLPQAIVDAQRIQTIENPYLGTNHNQTVVCAYGNTPVNCYPPATGSTYYKLSDWVGELSWWNKIFNTFVAYVNAVWNLFPGVGKNVIQDSLGNQWNSRIPPLPWSDKNGKPFANEALYLKAYNEWKGKTCILIPDINKVFCIDNFFVPNEYADLYPYVPLSSTEDIKGNIQVDSVSVDGPGISNVSFDSASQSAILFFPHLTESDQLGSSLQDTFIASGEAKTGAATAVAPPAFCTTLDVRSNPGDKLFATSLSGKLGYTASFTCDFDPPTCSGKPLSPKNRFCETEYSGSCVPSSWTCTGTFPNADCPNGYKCGSDCSCNNPPPQSCSKTVSIALSTSTNTPKIDDVWSRLVAGPTAVVKRMFPKLGTQIGTLKDIPGSTAITYSGAQASSAELNFPHIGGISEYFLKGIQTLLRPKGYGEPISFGAITPNPSEKVDCDQSAPDISLPKTIGKQALHALAIQWEGGKTGDHVLECYNDVARKSLAAGTSPASTFLMWLNESGGSNYNISNQDWGINSSQVAGFTAQLARFLQLPSAYKNNYPQCFGKTKTDTEVFFDLFAVGLQGGQCVPGAGQPYIDLFNSFWSNFTSCPFTGYPFNSSCY